MKNLDALRGLFHVGHALSDGRYARNDAYCDPISFKPGTKIDLAFDQSTSQTGIAIKVHGGPVVYIVDLINKGLPSKEVYMEFLKMFVTQLVKGFDVQYVIYEDPVEHSSTIMSRNVLLELRGFIKTLAVTVDEFQNATFVEINVATWRKHYLAAPCYSGRRRKTELVKIAAMEETLRRMPALQAYVDTFRGVPDSMDAVGILEGWTAEYFTDDKMKTIRVNKCMPALFSLGHVCEIVKVNANGMHEFMRSKFGAMVIARGYQVLAYNGDMSFRDNALRASSAFNEYCIILITERKDIQAIRWEAGVDLLPGELYAIITYRNITTNTLPLRILPAEEEDFWRHRV